MKTTIATIATVITLAFASSSFAKAPTNPLKDYNAKKIALTYVEALTMGNIEFNKHLFTKDFTYENAANNQVVNKRQYLDFLKANKGLVYDCKTSYELLDQVGKASIAKATMKYDNFTRVDFITIQQTEDGWKVSKVVTTYQ